MQYKIPQNVGIEDKIVGPLTLKQLIILAVGFGASYIFFAILTKLYELNVIEYIVIAIPAFVSVALALIKINGMPLIKFALLFLEFSLKPKKRIWDHRGIANIVSPDLTDAKKEEVAKEEEGLDQKTKKASNLKDLSQVLDSGGFGHLDTVEHEDIDTVHDDDLMTQAYFGHKESKTENMYWRTKDAHMKMLDMFAKLPVTQLKKGSKEAVMAQQEIAKVKEEVSAIKSKGPKASPGKPTSAPATAPATAPVTATSPPTPKPLKAVAPPPVQPKPVKPQAAKPATGTGTVAKTAAPATATPPPAPKPIKAVAPPPVQPKPVKPQGAGTATGTATGAPTGGGQGQATQQGQGQNTSAITNKKPRKRKRKIPQPARTNNSVNTTQKNQPAQYISKPEPPKAESVPKPQKSDQGLKDGEFKFEELKSGEIEINLD